MYETATAKALRLCRSAARKAKVALSTTLIAAGLVAPALAAGLVAPAAHAASNTFTVTRIDDRPDADPGDDICSISATGTGCTLRAAIQEANATPDQDTINFGINAAGGVAPIRPNSALPAVKEPVTIDGYTQQGAQENTLKKGTNAALKVELDGSNSGSAPGLSLETSGAVVKGLAINRFSGGGIVVGGSFNTIEGDFVGTDPSGTKALGNGFAGVDIEPFVGESTDGNTIGGFSDSERNLISGNKGPGVSLFGQSTAGTQVMGNLVGTQKDGTSALGNSLMGIGIFQGANGSFVGAGAEGAPNTVAFNDKGGVVVGGSGGDRATGNLIARNSIFSNVGLGIDLGNDGPTANDGDDPNTPQVDPDGDSGPNDLLNKPVLKSARTVSGKTTVKGTLSSKPNSDFVVQFFSNPSGSGQGKRFIGTTSVSTDGSGKASFSFSPQNAVAVGQTITAATVNPTPETSEFSAPKKVASS